MVPFKILELVTLLWCTVRLTAEQSSQWWALGNTERYRL